MGVSESGYTLSNVVSAKEIELRILYILMHRVLMRGPSPNISRIVITSSVAAVINSDIKPPHQ